MVDRPIFIVGASRSGTALLRSSLNKHPDVHIAGETHFFDDLRLSTPTGEPLDADQRQPVVDLFRGLSHRPYGFGGDPDRGWLEEATLVERAEARGGSADDFFAAWCELEGLHDDDVVPRRWGEKTPRHVYRIPDLHQAFPDAQIVAMVRDPRAVVASYRDWSNRTGLSPDREPGEEGLDEAVAAESQRVQQSYHPVLGTLLWRATVQRAAAARTTLGPDRVRVVRYEDLVTEPHMVLKDLAGWLGEDFHEDMVVVPVHNSSHMDFEREGGFRRSAIDRWRQLLTEDEIALVQTVAGGVLTACRYEPIDIPAQSLRALPGLLGTPGAALRAAQANQERMHGMVPYLWNRVRSLL